MNKPSTDITDTAFFEQLVSLTDDARQHLLDAPIIRNCLHGEISRDSYLAFLREAYHHVRHTVPLLRACRDRLPERLGWLRAALDEYIVEEQGHELWILDDIAACGGDVAAARDAGPGQQTELMVAYAYDTIARGNPVGFCGMIHVLEGTSVAIALAAAARIQSCLGLPDTAFSYLRSHGTLDQEHTAHFRQLMNRLDDPGDQQSVVHAARMFYRLYGDIFHHLPTASMEEPA
jgi:pyrroloquinoline quinone (PQQ) biosynthesis protein C